MNNYNLKAIKEKNEHTYLETSYYWGPGLPVFASEESIRNEFERCLNQSAIEIVKSGRIELYWVDEKSNLLVLNRLLSNDENASFLHEQYRKQVINAHKRQQPCYFFIQKGIKTNFNGSLELRLRQSCEAEPHKKGYKYGYNLSIVLGTSVHEIHVDENLKVVDITEHENILLPNAVFSKST